MRKLIEILQTDIKDIMRHLFSSGFAKFYNLGVDAFKKNNYEKAIEYFNLALREKNIKPQVYYNLALSYQSLKKYDRAISAYKKFLELSPNDYDGLYNTALTYFLSENYKKAIEYYEKTVSVKKEPENVNTLILAYISNNEIQKAVDFAESVLNEPVIGTDLYFGIAKVFENKNQFNKEFTLLDIAIEMYSNILVKNSKYFDAYLAKSICYAKKGEFENSVSFCLKAIETNPKSYEANNQMGLVLYCCDKVEESIKYYEQAVKLNPRGDYKIYSNLGYAYEKIKDYKKAVNTFSQMLSKFSDFPSKEEIRNHLRILKSL